MTSQGETDEAAFSDAEDSNERASSARGSSLKKRPWTADEDEHLR